MDKILQSQESRLLDECAVAGIEESGCCSLHGLNANRLAIDLLLNKGAILSSAFLAEQLSQKYIANEYNTSNSTWLKDQSVMLYWSLHESFENFESKIKLAQYNDIQVVLNRIDEGVNEFFLLQKLISERYVEEGDISQLQYHWLQSAADCISLGADFFYSWGVYTSCER